MTLGMGAATELSIRHLQTRKAGHVSSFFFGVFVDIFDLIGTPTVGEGIYCRTSNREPMSPQERRDREDVFRQIGLANVGAIRARSPKQFAESAAVNQALLFPWWRPTGLAARRRARPIVIDVMDPIHSDAAGALALAMIFSKRGNPVTALLGLPRWRSGSPPGRLGLVDMEALAGALCPYCQCIETYQYPIGRSRRTDEHLTPHDVKLKAIYKKIAAANATPGRRRKCSSQT